MSKPDGMVTFCIRSCRAASLMFAFLGIVYLALGFYILLSKDGEFNNATPQTAIGIQHFYFAVTCLMFCVTFAFMSHIKKYIDDKIKGISSI